MPAKCHAAYASLVLLSWSFTASALAADCTAYSQDGATGASFSTERSATGVGSLPFAPLSFFIADGAAVKIFSAPQFLGKGQMVGQAEDVSHAGEPYYILKPAPGGHMFAVGQTDLAATGVAAFACVNAGALWQQIDAFKDRAGPVVYFPGQTFATTGHTYHDGEASLTVDWVNGRRTMTFRRSHYLSPTTEGSLDLDSGSLHIVRREPFEPAAIVSEQTITPDPAVGRGVDFAYTGAITKLLEIVDLVLINAPGAGPGATAVTVPQLELATLKRALISRSQGL